MLSMMNIEIKVKDLIYLLKWYKICLDIHVKESLPREKNILR
jgi:hypothetical protein